MGEEGGGGVETHLVRFLSPLYQYLFIRASAIMYL